MGSHLYFVHFDMLQEWYSPEGYQERWGSDLLFWQRSPFDVMWAPMEERDAWRKGDGPVSNLERHQEVGPLDKKCI